LSSFAAEIRPVHRTIAEPAGSMRLAKGTRTAAISDRILLGEVNFNRFMVFSSELNRK